MSPFVALLLCFVAASSVDAFPFGYYGYYPSTYDYYYNYYGYPYSYPYYGYRYYRDATPAVDSPTVLPVEPVDPVPVAQVPVEQLPEVPSPQVPVEQLPAIPAPSVDVPLPKSNDATPALPIAPVPNSVPAPSAV